MAGDIWKFYINIPKRIMRLCGLMLFILQTVNSYHCHAGWCNYNEYCCGMNRCCDYLTGYWYYWIFGGIVIFSSIMVCCWLNSRRNRSLREEKSHEYVSHSNYGMTLHHGDPVYYHQQPPGSYYHGAPTEMQYISTAPKGNIPLLREDELLQKEPAYYPPHYSNIDRETPTAPPYTP